MHSAKTMHLGQPSRHIRGSPLGCTQQKANPITHSHTCAHQFHLAPPHHNPPPSLTLSFLHSGSNLSFTRQARWGASEPLGASSARGDRQHQAGGELGTRASLAQAAVAAAPSRAAVSATTAMGARSPSSTARLQDAVWSYSSVRINLDLVSRRVRAFMAWRRASCGRRGVEWQRQRRGRERS